MSSFFGSVGVGVGGIKGGGTEHDNIVMQQQVGADIASRTTEQEDASVQQDEIADKRVRPDQQRDDSKAYLNNNNSFSVGHSSGRDDGTEDKKHPPSAQHDIQNMTFTGRNFDSVYFSERDR